MIFDVGHGGGSFLFRRAVAKRLDPAGVCSGFDPRLDLPLSTGMNAGMKNMLNVMSKFLNIGMALDDVIGRSTWNPAREIKHEEVGHLSVGTPADITRLLRVEARQLWFIVDVYYGARMRGSQKLVCELTVREGKVVYDLNGITREDWDKLGAKYKAQGDANWDGTLGHTVRARK